MMMQSMTASAWLASSSPSSFCAGSLKRVVSSWRASSLVLGDARIGVEGVAGYLPQDRLGVSLPVEDVNIAARQYVGLMDRGVPPASWGEALRPVLRLRESNT